MSKETKKTGNIKYNRQVIETLVEKHKISDYYIRQCVAGRKEGVTPDIIKRDYKILERTLELKKQQFKML
ncbi:hypothetical protein [Myroides indicus]|uniref:Uncharacterized protein n=1 Tax=Myroides indicus TaxID=1323422 RepID=A0A4R7EUU6_9FLAO|nr:hypothetical protein [Myroides indicus]TDS50719.1 hypothetical protein C8P70_1512 [Myroides indicus]